MSCFLLRPIQVVRLHDLLTLYWLGTIRHYYLCQVLMYFMLTHFDCHILCLSFLQIYPFLLEPYVRMYIIILFFIVSPWWVIHQWDFGPFTRDQFPSLSLFVPRFTYYVALFTMGHSVQLIYFRALFWMFKSAVNFQSFASAWDFQNIDLPPFWILLAAKSDQHCQQAIDGAWWWWWKY